MRKKALKARRRDPARFWAAIRASYEENNVSIREVARRHGVTDAAIRKRAKKEGWERGPRPDTRLLTPRRPTAAAMLRSSQSAVQNENAASDQSAERVEPLAIFVPGTPINAEPQDLVDHARIIVAKLLDELSHTMDHIGEIEDEVIAYTENDTIVDRRRQMLRAVSLSALTNAMKDLAAAAKTLSEAESLTGKKAKEAARGAARTGRFGTPPPPPTLVQ